jgi:DNA-binding NarL/FixJ family response regulator
VIRILLADDHAIVRQGLKLVLDAEPGFEVIAEAGDGAEAVRAALADRIDLAVLDVSMPQLTGIQAARQITEQRPEIKVVLLSMYDNEQFVYEALEVGAGGYVLKSAAHQDLITACHAALRGETFFQPRGVAAVAREYLEHRGDGMPPDPLSPRESEVLKLIAEGMTAREIGEVLFISDKTVERHRSNILDKLGLKDRVGLTRYAIRRGLVEP